MQTQGRARGRARRGAGLPRSVHGRMILIIVLAFAASAVFAVAVVDRSLRERALHEAAEKARILLDRNLATHAYFNEELKPRVFAAVEPHVGPAYFDPVWMSSTYAVRRIEQAFRALAAHDYAYKEAAIDARTPSNEADAFERDFLRRLEASDELIEQQTVRTIDGRPYFTVLRRGETMAPSCLRCHSTPDRAPADMVAAFGPDRSFGRSAGEVVSALSVRVPLATAYAEADSLVRTLSLSFLGILAALVGALYVFNRRTFLAPLATVRAHAARLTAGPEHLGEQIAQRFGGEWSALVGDLNALSTSLQASHHELEERVARRTQALAAANEALASANAALSAEIDERRRVEGENERLIAELREALAAVRTLEGILPICARCKQIRDDRGAWRQVEVYVAEHTDAQFSHGLCPTCEKHFYEEAGLEE